MRPVRQRMRAWGMALFRGGPPAAVFLALAFALARPAPTSAQVVTPLAVWASSDNPELPAPSGFGASALFSLGPWAADVTFVRYGDDTRKSGHVCQAPGVGCRVEEVSTSARMSGLRVTALRAVPLSRAVEVRGGVGASLSELRATSLGISGRRASLHLPNTGQVGLLASGSVSVTPLSSLPLAAVGGISNHWVRMNGCVDPRDPTRGYAPFCGWHRFTEFHVGLSVTVPRG